MWVDEFLYVAMALEEIKSLRASKASLVRVKPEPSEALQSPESES